MDHSIAGIICSAFITIVAILAFFTNFFDNFSFRKSYSQTEEDKVEMIDSVERAQAFATLIEKLTNSYPDAKKFKVEASYEYKETITDEALCPVVSIEIER